MAYISFTATEIGVSPDFGVSGCSGGLPRALDPAQLYDICRGQQQLPLATAGRRLSGMHWAVARVLLPSQPHDPDRTAAPANQGYAAARANVADPRPGRHMAVVTCMDARIDVFAALGLHLGEAHVIRNAGGRVTDDVLRSLALSSHVLGVDTVVVMQHTECGLAGRDRRRVAGTHRRRFGILPDRRSRRRSAGGYRHTRRPPPSSLPLVVIAGFIYDVQSGEVEDVAYWERPTSHLSGETGAFRPPLIMTSVTARRGIPLCDTPSCHARPMGNWAMGEVLAFDFETTGVDRFNDVPVSYRARHVNWRTACLDRVGSDRSRPDHSRRGDGGARHLHRTGSGRRHAARGRDGNDRSGSGVGQHPRSAARRDEARLRLDHPRHPAPTSVRARSARTWLEWPGARRRGC